MTADPLQLALDKLAEDGAAEPVRAAFARRFAQLQDPDAGLLAGDALEPVDDVPALDDLEGQGGDPTAILPRLAVIKLNGGLGTSMGLRGPKSLIDVKPGITFLDAIARQVLALRQAAPTTAPVPLVLLDSFSTRADTLRALADRHPDLAAPPIPADFLQSREPKLDAETHAPIAWPRHPDLEWCPPGHGDVYVSLAASGMLATLLDHGIDWAFISNSDNLGATVDPRIPAYADAHGIPFVMEVVRGTPADRKGGHIARRRDDGRLVLRETAQTPPGDDSFTDVERWRFYNTNNLWVDLRALRATLDADPAGPALPLIVNRKTVDPRDPASPAVLQLETAMGAALGAIDGAQAVLVPRTRFAPVKTTDDLLVVRSDAYAIGDDGRVTPTFDGPPPVVSLAAKFYKSLPDMEARFPAGPPSLRAARSFAVTKDTTFGADVRIIGDVSVTSGGIVPDGETLHA
ncbi:UTP--glucose-1-phosphate uridylyltransferase [Baekduia alba]|uniref:UTP--glucose-1-phosphate uridylyltransferase n=1 Tax=Baekduia alba TaxID=2997333 RepID=UPI002342253A|nr:UTP--glucose-1-phosphate uridylyltransferase [Baekduia alba]